MKLSALCTRTLKNASQEDVSRNAQLLARAGYVGKLMAGVYSYLPLGTRVLAKIEQIIREEMDAIGGQEVLMPALHPREIWDQTKRWDKVDVLFKFKGAGDRDMTLGPTHEEVVTPLVTAYVQSYRDLPLTEGESVSRAVYQIQSKFRNEPRAKSGLLRGREFRMKDMYSFHVSQDDLDAFYERVFDAYVKIFDRLGLGERTVPTYASGGIFSKYSHEFQTLTPYGEDIVYKVSDKLALNKEIVGDPEVQAEFLKGRSLQDLEEVKAIEVGNIFKLSTRFGDDFGAKFADKDGTQKPIFMGCYGLGSSRVMGTIAEVLSDDKGLVWPAAVAPYQIHLIGLFNDESGMAQAQKLYEELQAAGFEVLFDDRIGTRAGEKFSDADLIGLPLRLVLSPKTIEAGGIEAKSRTADTAEMVPQSGLFAFLKKLQS